MKNKNASLKNNHENFTCSSFGSQRMSPSGANRLEEFKTELVTQLSAEFPDVQSRLVRQAVVEADALASLTPVPFLLLPSLAEEKVVGLHNWTLHQHAVNPHAGMAFAA